MTDPQPIRVPTTAELTIATPEGVLFRLPLAGPASRLYAMLLDTIIVLAAVNGVGLLIYWIFAKAPGFGVMAITLVEFAIGFAYGALLEGFWNGQTIGKRLFHLRVIDQSGLPLRIEQAWVRNLMRVFDALPLAYLVGGISALSSRLMQRFGDRVAGTLVVRETPLPAPADEASSGETAASAASCSSAKPGRGRPSSATIAQAMIGPIPSICLRGEKRALLARSSLERSSRS